MLARPLVAESFGGVIHDKFRSLEEALEDLREKHRQRPTRTLARMIEQLQTEIAVRKPA